MKAYLSQQQDNRQWQTLPRCTAYNEYLLVFIVEQNLVGISIAILSFSRPIAAAATTTTTTTTVLRPPGLCPGLPG